MACGVACGKQSLTSLLPDIYHQFNTLDYPCKTLQSCNLYLSSATNVIAAAAAAAAAAAPAAAAAVAVAAAAAHIVAAATAPGSGRAGTSSSTTTARYTPYKTRVHQIHKQSVRDIPLEMQCCVSSCTYTALDVEAYIVLHA